MPAWLQVVIAVLAPSGVVVTLIERTRRENNRDHNRNSELLHQIDGKGPPRFLASACGIPGLQHPTGGCALALPCSCQSCIGLGARYAAGLHQKSFRALG